MPSELACQKFQFAHCQDMLKGGLVHIDYGNQRVNCASGNAMMRSEGTYCICISTHLTSAAVSEPGVKLGWIFDLAFGLVENTLVLRDDIRWSSVSVSHIFMFCC